MTGNGTTWTYTYDADGMRTGRTNGTTTYGYVYNGGQLTQMTAGGNTLTFAYDATGNPQSVIYNDTAYYYAVNLQGDVTAILDSTGTVVVSYTYDAWGNILTTSGTLAATLGTHNPLRYRGYIYDQETQLYYLQSRYYSPKTGRFINADSLVSTGQGLLGNNMFAYCLNNPVAFSDEQGTATRSCLDHTTEPRDPWRNGGSGGGIPRRDYRHESLYNDISGIINGQAMFEYAEASFGVGSYARNGCAAIALYNMHQLHGKPRTLKNISDDLLYRYGTIFYGLFGAAPWHIGAYLVGEGFNVSGYGSYSALKDSLSDGDVIVFTLMNDMPNIFKGFHTMTAIYKGGQFIIYNISNATIVPYVVDSLLYSNKKAWVYGFIVRG